jgi:LAO/AO transport system kinase
MEMADGIVINKADGENVDEARRAAVHYRNALQLFPMPASGMRPQVLTYSGFYDLDIDKVWGMIEGYVDRVKSTGYFDERRRFQQRYWMYEAIDEQLKSRFYNMEGMSELLSRYEQMLLTGKITSFAAAGKVLDFFDRNGNNG